jgi:hypothetical protein
MPAIAPDASFFDAIEGELGLGLGFGDDVSLLPACALWSIIKRRTLDNNTS